MNFDRSLLDGELQCATYMGRAMHCKADIYTFDGAHFPGLMHEVWRLRDLAFREVGVALDDSANGCASDCDGSCRQLIVWDAEVGEIVGGYRYALGADVAPESLSIWRYFTLAPRFVNDYLPSALELGRSFVTLEYQSSRMGTKGLFALDNLWDGLGAVTVIEPDVRYLFGKFTMYPSYDRLSRDMIIYFLNKHFPDPDHLITPIEPLHYEHDVTQFDALFVEEEFKKDYRILNKAVRERGLNIPPLVNAYMGLSPTMKLFGTAINEGFGNVEETGILIAVDEILQEKRMRHIDTFAAEHPELINITSGANKIFYPVDGQKVQE